MESYTVQKSRVDFVFQSAIGLLNDFTFYWERTGTLASRIQNLLYLDTDIESNGQKPQTDAERFGIRLRTGQAVNLTYAPGACTPLVTSAAYLQLAANASGNLMRPLRTGEDIELFPLSQDGDPLRAVRLDRCFDGVQWDGGGKAGRSSCDPDGTGGGCAGGNLGGKRRLEQHGHGAVSSSQPIESRRPVLHLHGGRHCPMWLTSSRTLRMCPAAIRRM